MDILDAIATIRHAFRSVNLEPPTVILLGTHKEGMRFLSAVDQMVLRFATVGSTSCGHVVEMADGSAWMEIKVMDIAIRWPANKDVVSNCGVSGTTPTAGGRSGGGMI